MVNTMYFLQEARMNSRSYFEQKQGRHGWLGIWLGAAVVLTLLFAGSLRNANAQVTATISGTVTDPSGSVVPKAKITLTNSATQEIRNTVADGNGYFAYPSLNPGTYNLKVEAAGFKTLEQDGIKLNSGDIRNVLGLRLAVGATTETVTVNAQRQIIPLETGERAAVLDSKDIDNLALEGRAVLELLKVLPGVTSVPNGINNGASFNDLNVGAALSPVGQDELNANGAPNRGGTTQYFDGVDIDDPGCDCNTIATINPDMVQEVSVQTSNFGADAPRGPIVINAISKSGTSSYHGEAYFYARNDVLNANDWFSNHQGIPRGSAHYYYPGGNLGGPIPFTHKKLLVWGGYERFLQNTGNASVLQSYIPTSDMMSGNFTDTPANEAFCQGALNSSNTNGCNDLTGTILPDGSVVGEGNRPAGMIPSEFIDPGALALSKIWPAANANPATTPGGFNFVQVVPGIHDGWIYRLRADYNLSPKDSFFVSYQQGYDEEPAAGAGAHIFWTPANSIPFPGGALEQLARTKALSGHFTHIFNATLTNEFIAAWGWGYFPDGFAPNPSAVYRSTLGYNYGTVFNGGSKVIPSYASAGPFTFPDFSQSDILENPAGFFFRKSMPSFTDNLTKVWKTHTIEVGVFAQNTSDYTALDNNGSNVNGALNSFYGQNPNAITGQLMGSPKNPTANFLMGIVTSYAENNKSTSSDMAYQTFSVFGNDLWNITRRFTLEYGLRLDHIGHWYDRNSNYGVPVWTPENVASDFASGRLNPGLRWSGRDPGLPTSGSPDQFLWMNPRFGIAYDIFGTGRTIVRGGWGEYRLAMSDAYTDSADSSAQGQLSYSLPGQTSVLLSQISQLKPQSTVGAINGVVFAVPNTKTIPKVDSYSLTISQQLPWSSLFEVAYVGNTGSDMNSPGGDNITSNGGFADFTNQNKVPVGAFFKPDPVTGVISPNPENLGGPGSPNNKEADYRPYGREYGTNPIYVESFTGYSNYNGLQLTWVKRSNKLTFDLNYTWSKTMGTSQAVDPFDIKRDYGVQGVDRPEVLNTSYFYDIGNVFHGERILGGALNGWTVSGITTWQRGGNLQALYSPNFNMSLSYATINGAPISANNPLPPGVTPAIGIPTYYGTTAAFAIQPDLTCNPAGSLGANQTVQAKCFTPPKIGQYGPAQYPYLHGANYFDSDLVLFKTFHIKGSQTVQFRASAFNWLNHPLPQYSSGNQLNLYYNVDYQTKQATLSSQTSPTFGTLDSKAGTPTQRIMELSVRYAF
jgi:hypothetical protein